MTKALGSTLYATFTARRGRQREVAELLVELTRHVRAEPGNVRFEPFQTAGEPRGFFVFEAYRDEEAFDDHMRASHTERFNEALSGLIEEPRSVLTWVHGLDVPRTSADAACAPG